jgi:hypothetical protein
MKSLFRAGTALALLLLPLLPGGRQARAEYQVTIFATNADPVQLGPWYLYWPMERHFMVPAPTGYPFWPSPQALPSVAIGGPTCPPGTPYPPPPAAAPVVPAVPSRPLTTAPPMPSRATGTDANPRRRSPHGIPCRVRRADCAPALPLLLHAGIITVGEGREGSLP